MWTKVFSGLDIEEIKVGDGCIAVWGSRVTIRYTGYLNRGEVFQKDFVTTLVLGERNVIAGLERGIEGMCVGGIRRLRVSPHLAYRDMGVPGVIPVNAKLVFEVELLRLATDNNPP
jgi:FKBP-type peptidyl-prolyl cis-trans isomerase